MLTTTISSSLSPTQFSHFHWTGLSRHRRPLPSSSSSPSLTRRRPKTLTLILAASYQNPAAKKHHPLLLLIGTNPSPTAISAGRSKKKPGSPPSGGRIEGSGEVRRRAKENARRRSRRLSENRFYRRNNPRGKHGDSFTEEELQMIGLGYDRSVRFMAKDDPNLRHPHDWYKYGRYGPYSWRGIVVGPPIRGRFSDERVSLIGEVRDHEEWEEIERFDMASEFSRRLDSLGHRSHYWVFVRHPKWRVTDLPWQQWTLVSEVVVEAGKDQRLDKWSLMGRLGNKSRAMVTQCAAWMRPDIIYVKRPLYQCRFEPQDDFFKLLGPLLDPSTEDEYPCHLKLEEEEEGRVETCTYFGGLCKIVKISPKAYVDDVVKAYQKLSDDGKSRCLEFLLTNHPLELLHPYTKEWKVKLEEMEMGCDAPDESEDEIDDRIESEINWMEDSDDSGADEEEEEEDGEVIDVGEDEKDAELGMEEEDLDQKETEEYWDEQWKKALRSSEAMESLVKKSVEVSTEFYKRQMREEEEDREGRMEQEARGSTMSMDQEQSRELREDVSKIPPELFLKSAVRPFTYRNLVKEIVLMRHAIVDGDISFSS